MKQQIGVLALALVLAASLSSFTPDVYAKRATDFEQVELLIDAYHEIVNDFVDKPDADKLTESAVRSMIETLDDPHSAFFNEEEIKGFNKQVQGEFSGIGAEVEMHNDLLRIVSPLQDSPAWNAGIQPGDIVLTIDGASTKGLRIGECIEKLTGPVGTKVTIRVRHTTGQEVELTITRAKITVRTVQGWARRDDNRWDHMLDGANKVGYVRLAQFTTGSTDDVAEALESLKKQGVRGVILDLRFNPGGLLPTAIAISNKFLKKGDKIVSTKGRTVPERTALADGQNTFPAEVPLVVLVNEASASASEILAGALAENGRAKIVGTRSFGKGSVQQVKRLESGGGAIKLTNAYYYLPSGRNLHRKPGATQWGVDPDDGFYVPMSGQEIQDMVRIRREVTGPENKLAQVKGITPQWITQELKDPQLAAGLTAVLGKLATGDWPKVGKSGADELARLGRLELLERQRDFLNESLKKVEEEIRKSREGAPAGDKPDASKPAAQTPPTPPTPAPQSPEAPTPPAPKP